MKTNLRNQLGNQVLEGGNWKPNVKPIVKPIVSLPRRSKAKRKRRRRPSEKITRK